MESDPLILIWIHVRFFLATQIWPGLQQISNKNITVQHSATVPNTLQSNLQVAILKREQDSSREDKTAYLLT